MDYTTIGITVLWTFLFLYIIVASIDFGAGFFTLHTKLTGEEKKINHLVERYLNPVWEVTNVFFVFLCRIRRIFLIQRYTLVLCY